MIDPTISLGNVLNFIGLLLLISNGYAKLQTRLAVIETDLAWLKRQEKKRNGDA
jgi:trehalose utilization protein